MRKTLGIFGGTFDPIHHGHLRLALEIKQQLQLDELRLLPCHQPPHRAQPQVSSAQRAAMLRIALSGCAELQVDERELARNAPSYSYDTLSELRAEIGAQPSLVLCMGMDSFVGLNHWHRWRELLNLAHIVVVARPGWALPNSGELAELSALAASPSALRQAAAGSLVVIAPRLLPISATEIRAQLAAGESPRYLLPDAVLDYIQANRLYGGK